MFEEILPHLLLENCAVLYHQKDNTNTQLKLRVFLILSLMSLLGAILCPVLIPVLNFKELLRYDSFEI